MKKNSWLIRIMSWWKRNSKEPWLCFESQGMTPDGLEMRFEYNDALIKSLSDAGLAGHDDDETVQNFFIMVARSVAGQAVVNEFEAADSFTPSLKDPKNGFAS